MDYKEYSEQQTVTFELISKVNGVIVDTQTGSFPTNFSYEQASQAVHQAVKDSYEDLPEPDETKGYADVK